MASLQTETKIANAALKLLGSTKRIIAVDLNSDEQISRDIAEVWDELRDFHLARHSWNFAIHFAKLNRSDPPPGCDWANAFALPADYLRWLPRARGHRDYIDGEVAGGFLLTNAEAVNVRYIRRVTSVALWSAAFVSLMVDAVADAIAEAVTQAEGVSRRRTELLADKKVEARRVDGLETGRRRRGAVTVRSDILAARNRRGTSVVRR